MAPRRKRHTSHNVWSQLEFLEILKANDLSFTKAARQIGCTPQNAIQLAKRLGIKIARQVELSEPQRKRLPKSV